MKKHDLQPMMDEVLARKNQTFYSHVNFEKNNWKSASVIGPHQKLLHRVYENESIYVQFLGFLFGNNTNTFSFLQSIIAEYEREGPNCVRNFRGHFCIQIFCKKSGILRIFVDTMATRPLYYHYHNGRVFYCSEIKGLLPVGVIPKTWNKNAVLQSYSLGYVLDDTTIVREVKCLPAGHYIEILSAEGKYSVNPYHQFDASKSRIDCDLSLEKACDFFEETVDDSLASLNSFFCSNGYKPLVTLSGGLDSRAVLTLLNNLHELPIETLSWGHINSDDHILGNRVAGTLNTSHLYKSYSDGSWLIDHLDQTVDSYECMYSYMDTARAHFLLHNIDTGKGSPLYTGLSGDMIMGSFINWRDIIKRPSVINWTSLADRMIKEMTNVSFYGVSALSNAFGENIVGVVKKDLCTSMQKMHCDGDDYFSFIDKWNLYNKQSRGIIAYFRGIEEYTAFCSPFYDTRLIDFALSMPLRFRFSQMAYISFLAKRVFKKELRQIPWQKSQMSVTRFGYWNVALMLGKKLNGKIARRKDPFASGVNANPYNLWLEQNKKMREFIYENLSQNEATDWLFVDQADMNTLLYAWSLNSKPYNALNLNLLYMVPIVHFAKKYRRYLSLPNQG